MRFLSYLDRRVSLEDGREIVVGRALDCTVSIENDRSMSRRHARFRVVGEKVFVEDLGSRNGVVLNGRAVTSPTEVVPGDRVLVGGHVFQIVDEHDLRRTRPSGKSAALGGVPTEGLVFDEVTDITPPEDLLARAHELHAQGALPDSRRQLLRFAGAVEIARSRGRPLDAELIGSGCGLMLVTAGETADAAWVERALGIYGDAKLMLPEEQLVMLANLIPVLADVRPAIRRYMEVLGAGGDRPTQVLVAKLRALSA